MNSNEHFGINTVVPHNKQTITRAMVCLALGSAVRLFKTCKYILKIQIHHDIFAIEKIIGHLDS